MKKSAPKKYIIVTINTLIYQTDSWSLLTRKAIYNKIKSHVIRVVSVIWPFDLYDAHSM